MSKPETIQYHIPMSIKKIGIYGDPQSGKKTFIRRMCGLKFGVTTPKCSFVKDETNNLAYSFYNDCEKKLNAEFNQDVTNLAIIIVDAHRDNFQDQISKYKKQIRSEHFNIPILIVANVFENSIYLEQECNPTTIKIDLKNCCDTQIMFDVFCVFISGDGHELSFPRINLKIKESSAEKKLALESMLKQKELESINEKFDMHVVSYTQHVSKKPMSVIIAKQNASFLKHEKNDIFTSISSSLIEMVEFAQWGPFEQFQICITANLDLKHLAHISNPEFKFKVYSNHELNFAINGSLASWIKYLYGFDNSKFTVFNNHIVTIIEPIFEKIREIKKGFKLNK